MSCGAPLAASTTSPTPPTGMPSLASSQKGSRIDQIKGTLNNAIALVRNPVGYMTQNKDQTISVNSLMINYVAILALIPLIGRVIGDLIFYSKGKDALGYAIGGSILAFFLDIIAVFVIGWVIMWLAPRFKTSTNQARATMLAAFVYTPVLLIGILNIYPILGYLALLGLLYGLYILYRGLPILLNTPADQTLMYVIAILVVSFIIEIVIALIIGGLDAVATKHGAILVSLLGSSA